MANTDGFDTIVIGGGLMGTSAAWHLSADGEKVLLIEKQPKMYHQGSSYGEARITRSLGPKEDIFSWLHNRAVAETKKLAGFLDGNSSTGSRIMDEIYTTNPVTYIYYHYQKEITDKLIIGQLDPISVALNPEEAARKFGMHIAENAIVIRELKEYSGTLNPGLLIKNLHRAINLCDSHIKYNCLVSHLSKKNGLFEISLNDSETGNISEITAKKLVIAAGPYSGNLLKNIAPALDQRITPKRVCLSFFSISQDTWHRLTAEHKSKITDYYPLIDMSPDFIFSMIEKWDNYGAPVIKTGGHLRREPVVDLDSVWKKELSQNEIEWAHHTTARYFEMLNVPVGRDDLIYTGGYSCVYSMTDSEVPLVSEVADSNNNKIPGLVVMGGMSGIGAKGSMVYGLIAKNLLLNKNETDEMYLKTVHALSINRNSQ